MNYIKAIPYFFLIILFSCNNEIKLQSPEANDDIKLLNIENGIKDDLQIIFIGDFSGKILVKSVLFNSNNKVLKKGVIMKAGDSFSDAVFFKYSNLKEELNNVKFSLWIKNEFQHNRFIFKKIIIIKNNKEFEINQNNFSDYFDLVNIDYNKKTGEMSPVKVEGEWIKSDLVSTKKFNSILKEL